MILEKTKIPNRNKIFGGIKNFEQALAFANAGCTRLGTSSTVEIVGDGTKQAGSNSDY
jgi:deoxyribose-phosphate aldolase